MNDRRHERGKEMAKNKNWFLINGRAKNMKAHCTLEFLTNKYPDMTIKKIGCPPSMATMERWVSDGVAKATDGCRVEPDGNCQHGHESWIRVLGWI